MTSDGSVTPELPGQGKGQQGESASGRGASEERLGRTRGLLAVGGLLAGVLAFGVGEAVYDLVPAGSVTQHALGLTKVTPTVATETVAAARNGALAFGVLGLFLGGCLGLAGGLARRSSFAVAAGGLGSVLGFAAGVGASLALLPFCIASRFRYPDNDLVISFLMHGAIWGLVGRSGRTGLRGRSRGTAALGSSPDRRLRRCPGRGGRLRSDRGGRLPRGKDRRPDFTDLGHATDGPAPGDGGNRRRREPGPARSLR